MTLGAIVALVVALVILNLFGLWATSEEYLAFSIRWRASMNFALFGSKRQQERAEYAEIHAERISRWLRPIVMVGVNLIWAWILLSEIRRVQSGG